jgi:hypothetical protein
MVFWKIALELLRRIEGKLQPFAEALEDWVNRLLSERLPPNWREQLHAYLDTWQPHGYEVAAKHRPILENWIEAWAKDRGLLPKRGASLTEESSGFQIHPLNRNVLYRLQKDSELTKDDVILALQLAKSAVDMRRVVAFLEAVQKDPGLLTRINDALNPFADRFGRNLDVSQRLFDLKILLLETELRFDALGYDRIEWREFRIDYGKGLDAAEQASQAGPPHGIQPVFVQDAMTASGVARLTGFSAKLLARAGSRLAQRGIRFLRPSETVRQEATRLLQKVVDEELATLSRNPAIAQEVLRPREIAASVDQRVAKMQFGNALERMVGRRIELEPALRDLLRYQGHRAGPDFLGIGRFGGLKLDVTTVSSAAEHASRPYGQDMIIITYTRPAMFP